MVTSTRMNTMTQLIMIISIMLPDWAGGSIFVSPILAPLTIEFLWTTGVLEILSGTLVGYLLASSGILRASASTLAHWVDTAL